MIVEEPLGPDFLKYRRATMGSYAHLTTTELFALAMTCRDRLDTVEGRTLYNALVEEFCARWQQWIDRLIKRLSPKGPNRESFRKDLASDLGLRLASGSLATMRDPKAWGLFVKKIVTNLALDMADKEKRRLDRDAIPIDDRVEHQHRGGPRHDPEDLYPKIRLEVLVLSHHDYRPLQAFDRYFHRDEKTPEIAAALCVAEKQAERIVKKGCDLMADAAEKFGWLELAAECRRRSQSLKGTKR